MARAKGRRGRRRGPGRWLLGLLLRLVALAAALAVLAAGALYAIPVSLFAVEPEDDDLLLTDGLPGGTANVLLLGRDMLNDHAQRSDTIIIASVGYGRLGLASVLRDTQVDIPGRGKDKLNAAYAYGGPALVMKTLNQNLGLNIMHYASVDFLALVELVDALGGVELSVSEAEAGYLNRLLESHKAAIQRYGYAVTPLTQSGENIRLSGVQALAYVRIRKLGNYDYERTLRQRRLLAAMLGKLRANLWNPFLLAKLGTTLLRVVDTNMSVFQLLSYGEKALLAGAPETLRLPVDGSFTDDGSKLTIDSRQANIEAFRQFAYN